MTQEPQTDHEGIDSTVEALTKGYDLLTEQIKSLQNRCGVGLGVMVAASPSGLFRFLRIMPEFLDRGWWWMYGIGVAGMILFIIGTISFLRGFFIDSLYLPYDKDDLIRHVWKQSYAEAQLYRLSFLNTALDGLDSAATEKRNQLRNGIGFVIAGVLVFLIIELFRYAAQLQKGA